MTTLRRLIAIWRRRHTDAEHRRLFHAWRDERDARRGR
jgi:hypothetical protein